MPKKQITIEPNLRLQLKHGVAIGPGKAAVLESIAGVGSISAAGRALGMSYKRIWLLVDSMNTHFRQPLVVTVKGGNQRGGAELTPLGVEVLTRYRHMEKTALRSIEAEIVAFEAFLKKP